MKWFLPVSAVALLLGFMLVMVGVVMFLGRNGLNDGSPPSGAYHALERGSIVLAAILSAIGFLILARHLQGLNGGVYALIGASAYLIASVPLAIAEIVDVMSGEERYPLIVTYVVLAYLAMAVIGVSLVRTGYLPLWIGWASIAWSVSLLVLLVVITPRDIYYPVSHHVMPLIIGIALLVQRSPEGTA